MKLQFNHPDINEYFEGGLHFKNDGEPIEVAESVGAEMLKAKTSVGGEEMPVFVQTEIAFIEDATEPELKKMKKPELEALAESVGIETEGDKKDEIIDKLMDTKES